MRVWCFNDAHNWGLQLAKKAQDLGHDAHLFDDPSEPDIGYVFFHMHHHPQTRLFHKRSMAVMALNPQLILVPDYRSSTLYDDKLEQARQFSRWTPRTRIFYAPGRARSFVDRSPAYPFISKSSEGSAGRNVRLIRNTDDARFEIKSAFSDLGIRTQYEPKQIGYLLWQDYIAERVGDIRVVAIGTRRLVIKRGHRDPGQPADKIVAATELTHEMESALAYANEFFAAEGIKWGAVDLMYSKTDVRWFLLDLTVGWNMPAYYDGTFFTAEGKPTGQTGLDVWEVLLGEMGTGAFLP